MSEEQKSIPRERDIDAIEKLLKDFIRRLENMSVIELVPVIAERSDDYWAQRLWLQGLGGITLGYLFTLNVPWNLDHGWVGVLAVFLFTVLLTRPVKNFWKYLWPKAWRQELFAEAAQQVALNSFYQMDIARTSSRAGLLLYVSLYERRLVLLPDRALNRDGQQFWQQQAQQLTNHLQLHGWPLGLRLGLEEVLTEWALKFPLKDHHVNPNELADDVHIK